MLKEDEKLKMEEIFVDKDLHLKECFKHTMNVNCDSEIGLLQKYKEDCHFFQEGNKLIGIDKNFVKYFEYSSPEGFSFFLIAEIFVHENESRIFILLYNRNGQVDAIDTTNSTCVAKVNMKKNIKKLFYIREQSMIVAHTEKNTILLYKTRIIEEQLSKERFLNLEMKKIGLHTPSIEEIFFVSHTEGGGGGFYSIIDGIFSKFSLHESKDGIEFRFQKVMLHQFINEEDDKANIPIHSSKLVGDFLLVHYKNTRFLVLKVEEQSYKVVSNVCFDDNFCFDASLDNDSNLYVALALKSEERIYFYKLDQLEDIEKNMLLCGSIKVDFRQKRSISSVHFFNKTKSLFYVTKENDKNSGIKYSLQFFEENQNLRFSLKKKTAVKKKKSSNEESPSPSPVRKRKNLSRETKKSTKKKNTTKKGKKMKNNN